MPQSLLPSDGPGRERKVSLAEVNAANRVELEWKNIEFSTSNRKGEQKILSNVSGKVKPGQLCAIMGPSGAGKSSLLNILAGRIVDGGGKTVTGDVSVNGAPIDPVKFRKRIAYVMQEDALFATETPREALRFSAALRLSKTVSPADRDELVEKTIERLLLTKCANTFIGNIMIPGVSGGEKKRTAIGVELISNPDVLFLDEPTSGLDSFSAFSVVKILQKLALSGRTIICTIHQPSSEVYDLFDQVLLLSNGKLIYHDDAAAVTKYFADLGHVCPPHYNPADFVMFLMQQQTNEGTEALHQAWQKQLPPTPASGTVAHHMTRDPHARLEPTSGLFTQFKFLAHRELRGVIRDKAALGARFGTTIFLNLIVGVVFLFTANWGDVGANMGDMQLKLNNHFGAVVQVAIGGMFGLAQPALLSFPMERPIFLREYATGTYGAIPYFFSKIMVEIPMAIAQSATMFILTYWLIGFQGNFGFLVLTVATLGLVAASTSLLIGSASSNVQVAIQLSPLIFVPQLLFAGFFISISDIPVWLRWAQYLCSLKYSINLVMLLEFAQVPRNLDDALIPTYNMLVYGCPSVIDNHCPDGVAVDQTALYPRTDVDATELGAVINLVILIGVFWVFRLTACVLLAVKARS